MTIVPGETVVYESTPRWVRWGGPFLVALGLALSLISYLRDGAPALRHLVFPLTGLLLIAASRSFVRARVVADDDGVDLARRGARIRWEDVDHVRRPGPWAPAAVLVLTDGAERSTPFPARFAERLASVGGVPLKE